MNQIVDQSPNKWFVCPRPPPEADLRLFLFPYAGGGPAVFNKWLPEFPANIEAWIAHYPGRGSRHAEAPMKEISTLVEHLSEAIHRLLDKPFAFFGHSLGGLVAFELARRLRRNRRPQPQILFISACAAPHLSDGRPLFHSLPDAEFLRSLQELNGIPSELLEQPEAMQLLLPTVRADFQALETYVYASEGSPLEISIVAFGGREDARVNRQRLEGWASHTSSGFESEYFPGGHFFIHTARESVFPSITDRLIRFHENLDSRWSAPPQPLELQPHQVDVWRVRLNVSADVLDQLEAALSEEERQRAARFHFPADRERFIASHGVLRDVLARYLHRKAVQFTYLVSEYGKPALGDHSLQFNLSHSGDFALIAITLRRRVGVDVEWIRSSISSERIPRRFFSEAEIRELDSLPLERREAAFFACWTRKEAYIKAQGLGLSLPLQSFDVSLRPDEPAILRATRPDPDEAAHWTLFPLETDPCYASAVAVEGQNPELRLWDWKME